MSVQSRSDVITHSYLKAKNWLGHIGDEYEGDDLTQSMAVGCPDIPQNPDHVDNLREKLLHHLESGRFDMWSSLFIVLNAMAMIIGLEHVGHGIGRQFGLHGAYNTAWPGADIIFPVLDMVFACIFLAELFLRVFALRLHFFVTPWNYLDVFLVSLAWFEFFFGDALANLSAMKVLRLFRLVKALRLVKMMRAFRDLRVLTRTIAGGLSSLFWSAVLLGVLEVVAAILLVQLLQTTMDNPDTEVGVRDFVWRYFGTMGRGCFTMFEITMTTGWAPISRFMIEEMSGAFVVFWVPYVTLVAFCIVKIAGAMFIKETLSQANKEAAEESEEAMTGDKGMSTAHLQQILRKYDTTKDGVLSQEDFYAALDDEEVRTWLGEFEVDPVRLAGVFELLNSHQEESSINLEEFFANCFSLKSKEPVDSEDLLYATERIFNRIGMLEQQIAALANTQRPSAVQVGDRTKHGRVRPLDAGQLKDRSGVGVTSIESFCNDHM
jgi:hypothetical protein